MRRGLGVVVAVALVACSASHDPTSDELAAYDRLRAAECSRIATCASESVRFELTYETCGLSWARDEIAAGRAHLDHHAAQSCIDGIAALGDCIMRANDFDLPDLPFESACASAVVYDREVCGAGTCDPHTESCRQHADCSGTCIPLPGEGERCLDFCAAGLRCSASVCVRVGPFECRGRAVPEFGDGYCYAPLGATCTGGGCVPGAYCSPASATCVNDPPPLALGAACDPTTDPGCAPPYLCDVASHRCISAAASRAGFCMGPTDCDPGTYCDPTTSACTASVIGSECSARSLSFSIADSCPDGMLCGADVLCHQAATVGAACDDTIVCAPGTLCARGRCATVAMPNEPCDDATPCFAPFGCVDGSCQVVTRDGDAGRPCLRGGSCEEGVCESGRCAWLPDGAACPMPSLCRNCVDGVCQPVVVLAQGASCVPDIASTCGEGLSCHYSWPYIVSAYCCP